MKAVLTIAAVTLLAVGAVVTVMVMSFAIELLAVTLQAPELCTTDMECELRCPAPKDEVRV